MAKGLDKLKTSKYGLVGRNISYSFSRAYFAEKFKSENLPHSYVNFDLKSIQELDDIIKNNPDLNKIT